MKIIIKLILLFVWSFTLAQTNLLDTSYWTVGSGTVPGFPMYGLDTENLRELGIGPYGSSVVLWKAIPDSLTSDPAGGWHGSNYDIDHTKTYRLTVWLKRNTTNGETFFALDYKNDPKVTNLNGGNLGFFFDGDLPSINNWYLLVAYVHNSSYVGTNNIGGIYDLAGGKVLTITDLKFLSNAISISHQVELYDTTNSADNQFFYDPTIYEINGQEPTIQELINTQPHNSQNPSTDSSGYWNLNNQDVYYTNGNVGIGTSIADSKLTVKGSIHSEEVKVDLSVPAPDYVFKSNYHLTSLEKLQEYITIHGHLPNIPSAKYMEANGIELGIMNMRFLEKIEELTLYILQQQEILKIQGILIKEIEEKLKNK